MKHCLFVTALLLAHSLAEEPKLNISGIWMMGQSLCDGSESLPIVTTDDTGWGNYAFQRGVRTWLANDHASTPEMRPPDQFALVPLKATVYGGLGETVANGMADHLSAALPAEKKQASRFLVTCAGDGVMSAVRKLSYFRAFPQALSRVHEHNFAAS